MSELWAPSRRLIDAARAGEGPTSEDRARNHRKLMLRVGAAAAVTTVAAPTTAAGTLLGAGAAGAVAKVVAVLVFVGAGGGVILATRGEAPVPAVARTAAARIGEAARAATPSPSQALEEPAADDPPATPAIVAEAPPEVSGNEGVKVAAKPAARAVASAPGGIDGELELIGAAQRELSAGRADRALELLEQHKRTFGAGALGEERRAAHVVALCKAGKVEEARAEAKRFLAERPSSPLAERVRGACR